MKKNDISLSQEETIKKLEDTFKEKPYKIKKENETIIVIFNIKSKIKGLESIRFLHSFVISRGGSIKEKRTRIHKGDKTDE